MNMFQVGEIVTIRKGSEIFRVKVINKVTENSGSATGFGLVVSPNTNSHGGGIVFSDSDIVPDYLDAA